MRGLNFTGLSVLILVVGLSACEKAQDVTPKDLRQSASSDYMLPEVVITADPDGGNGGGGPNPGGDPPPLPGDPYNPSDQGGSPTGGSGGSGGSGNAYGLSAAELAQFRREYRSQMSASELAIFDSMAADFQSLYLQNAYEAIRQAERLYPGPGLHNGAGDAFRHALFVALNTRIIGENLAQRLSNAHEDMPGQDPNERAMDLHNNYAGILIGLDPNSGSLMVTVNNWLNDGRLQIIVNGQVVPSRP